MRGDIRLCKCGCGNAAATAGDKRGNNKGWKLYAEGHAPHSPVEITIPGSQIDLAYAAGILDGEGCIHSSFKQYKNSYVTLVHVQIAMCSDLVIKWFLDTFGGTDYAVQRSATNKPIYTWSLRGAKNVIKFLSALLPFLKEKKDRAEIAILLAQEMSDFRGRKGLTQEQIDRRREISNRIRSLNHVWGRGEVTLQ